MRSAAVIQVDLSTHGTLNDFVPALCAAPDSQDREYGTDRDLCGDVC